METSEYLIEEKVEHEHWWFVGRRKLLADVLQSLCAQQKGEKYATSYDIGCGVGNHHDVIARYAHRTVGIESNAQAAEFARAKGYDEVIQTDIEGFAARGLKEAADLVICMDVLEHIEDDVSAVREIVGLLKHGGVLVVTVPAFMSLWGIQDEVGHHYRRYRLASLKQILESSGLRIAKRTYFNTFLFLPIFLARQVTKRLTAKRIVSENGLTGPLSNAILRGIFLFEITCINRGIRFPFGVSALIVAKKA